MKTFLHNIEDFIGKSTIVLLQLLAFVPFLAPVDPGIR